MALFKKHKQNKGFDSPLDDSFYRLISENTNDLICIYDPKGFSCLYCNPAIRALTGYLPEEIIGQGPGTFIYPDDKHRILKELEKVAKKDHRNYEIAKC